MTKLLNFTKSFAKPFSIAVLALGLIAGAAMALDPVITYTGLGITVWSLAFVLTAGWVTSGVVGVYVKNYKIWKESDKGYKTMVIVYYAVATSFFILTIVSLVLH